MKLNPSPRVRTLDVRAMIAAGGLPFEKILTAVHALTAQDTLVLVTPFLPAPLMEKLHAEGFASRPERRADGAWETQFKRALS